MKNTILPVVIIAVLNAGCASVDSKHDTDGNSTGIRYYNSAPFILAYSDGKGGIEASVVYLPDTTRVLSLDATAFFSQNMTVMKFDQSILTSSDSTADATAVPKAIVEAAKTVATAAIAASANKPNEVTEYQVPAPYIYRIYYGKDPNNPEKKIWQLVGGQARDKEDSKILPINSTFVRVVE